MEPPDASRGDDTDASAGTPQDLRFYGTVAPTGNFQITVPVQARRELGFREKESVFVFGSLSMKRLIVLPSPPADELLELLTDRASE